MARALWTPIVFLCLTLLVSSEVSVEYADCPKDCSCEKALITATLSCSRLVTDKNLVSGIPYTKFELTHVDGPVTLGPNAFVNMGLDKVNFISIANVTIESIDKDAFSGLKYLNHIRMVHAKINNLHPDTFKNITSLTKLSLVGNPLSNDLEIHSESLDQLRLAHCGLKNISNKIFNNAPNLSYLDLTGNGIEKLSADFFDAVVDLDEVNLSHNKLSELPKELFSKNEDVDVLDISYNPLTSFSGEHVSNLETLNLKSCLLTEIDDKMFKNMKTLYNLNLSNNKISQIHENAFADMQEISSIDLSSNELEVLNDKLFSKNIDLQKLIFDNNQKLTGLPQNGFVAPKPNFAIHYFSCSNCNLKTLSKNTFINMPNLVTLILSHNNINDISTGVFQNLVSLIELDISYNQITTIDDQAFKKSRAISKLNLSFNTLKSLHAGIFKTNSNLQYLDISHCGLFSLWTGDIKDITIPSLLSINASNNYIELVKKEDIAITNQLKSLDISNNNIHCTPQLRDLIIYLNSENIKNTAYITHEKQSYDFETREKDETSWQLFAKELCPDIIDDDEEDEIENEENIDMIESDTTNDDYNDKATELNNEVYDDVDQDEEEEEIVLPYQKEIRIRYSYTWLILIFLGTALVVLGLVANITLFILRRRQPIPVPRIISVPRMSRLKKNSGLVYQQLSEEHGPKTPIFSRFTPLPTVHGNFESEHV